MKIGPECHQGQQKQGRRSATIGRSEHSANPGHHDRHRQDMRASQKVIKRQQEREHRQQNAMNRLEMRRKQIDKDRNSRGDRQRGQDDRPGPSPLRVHSRIKYLG